MNEIEAVPYHISYYVKHREKILAYAKDWNRKHPEVLRERRHRGSKRINAYQKNWRMNLKKKWIERLGGKCENCGLAARDFNLPIFTFHHKNSNAKETLFDCYKKDFNEKIKKGSISLFCFNCHILFHHGGLVNE